jgi:hypothetical protein
MEFDGERPGQRGPVGDSGGEPRFGGSIEQTLAGQAQLDVMGVIKEAWARTYGTKHIVIGGMLLASAAAAMVTLLLLGIFGEEDTLLSRAVRDMVVMLVVYPLMAGVFMVALRHSVGAPVSFADQFAYYPHMLPIVLVGLLQSFLTQLGFLMLILPGIYLSIALSLALLLKADRDLPIIECLTMSVRLVNRKFVEVALLWLAVIGLVLLGVFSLIGWIWTIPWSVMIFSIVYRQLVGYRPAGITAVTF